MTRKQYFITILILGALSTIGPFSIDMYLPGFPAIAEDLRTSMPLVQLSLTSYLVGTAFGQLFYGPLLDRFGRKIPLYMGLVVYILSSFGCAYTDSIEEFIAMRFVQALGGCAGMVASQALVRDLFPVEKTAQAFSLIILVISVSPMIAPTIGGYTTVVFGWHSIFLILGGITALIMVAVYHILPEGNLPDRGLSLRPRLVMKSYLNVMKQPQFLVYTLAGGIATAAPFAYIAGSPDVFLKIYEFSEEAYGWIFAILAFAMIGTTQLNHVLLKKFRSAQIIKVTLIYQTVIGLILIVVMTLDQIDPYLLILFLFIFLTGQGLTSPNAAALSLAPFSRHAGSASALLGSFRMTMGGLTSAAVGLFHNDTALPMVVIMVACAVLGLLLLALGNVTLKYRAKRREVEDNTSVLIQ